MPTESDHLLVVRASKLCADSQGGRTVPDKFPESRPTEELVYSPLSRRQHNLETVQARPEHIIGRESQVLVFVDLQLASVSQPTFEHFDCIRFSVRNHPTMLHLQERHVLKTQRTHTVIRADVFLVSYACTTVHCIYLSGRRAKAPTKRLQTCEYAS